MYHYRIIHRDDAPTAQEGLPVRAVANCHTYRQFCAVELDAHLADWVDKNNPAFPCVIIDARGAVLARDQRIFV